MKMQKTRLILMVFFTLSCIIFLFSKQVQADSFSVYANVQVPNNPYPNNALWAFGSLNASVEVTGTTYQQYYGSTLGYASATATIGQLRAYAESEADTENGSLYGLWGVARANAYFSDTITVSSSVLPTGTRVELYMVINLGGYFWYNGTNNQGTYIEGIRYSDYVTATNTKASASLSAPYFNFSLQVSDNASNYPQSSYWVTPVSDSVSGKFFALVNYPFQIYGGLSVEADSSTYIGWDPIIYPSGPPSESTSMADFGDTATFTITSLTPGTSIISASGYDYSGLPITPVPEPATMLLLGSGLIGLAGYGRRKFFKK